MAVTYEAHRAFQQILPIFLQLAGGAAKKDLGKTADVATKEAAYDLGQGICDELPGSSGSFLYGGWRLIHVFAVGLTNAIMQALNDANNMAPLYEKLNNVR